MLAYELQFFYFKYFFNAKAAKEFFCPQMNADKYGCFYDVAPAHAGT